jgi:hypothetical protein
MGVVLVNFVEGETKVVCLHSLFLLLFSPRLCHGPSLLRFSVGYRIRTTVGTRRLRRHARPPTSHHHHALPIFPPCKKSRGDVYPCFSLICAVAYAADAHMNYPSLSHSLGCPPFSPNVPGLGQVVCCHHREEQQKPPPAFAWPLSPQPQPRSRCYYLAPFSPPCCQQTRNTYWR